MLKRPLLPPLLLLASFLVACSQHADDESNQITVGPSYVGAFQVDETLQFAVGLRSQLRVRDSLGEDYGITSATCADGSCKAEQVPDPNPENRFPMMLVTPNASVFHIHLELNEYGSATALDKDISAVDGTMGAIHRGAGPGVPFIVGTTITWYIGPHEKSVAWDSTLSTISVTPPFELVSAPELGDGPDQDSLVRVQIRATAPGTGTLTHMNGNAVATFPLTAIARADIRKLHIAPAPAEEQMSDDDAQALASIATNRLSLVDYSTQTVWVVFETADGTLGIAGAGESLPAPASLFDVLPYSDEYYDFDIPPDDGGASSPALSLEDQPFIELQAKGLGTSKLLLRVGDLTGAADITVTEAQ